MSYGQPSFQVPWREGAVGTGVFSLTAITSRKPSEERCVLRRDHHALPNTDAVNTAEKRPTRP